MRKSIFLLHRRFEYLSTAERSGPEQRKFMPYILFIQFFFSSFLAEMIPFCYWNETSSLRFGTEWAVWCPAHKIYGLFCGAVEYVYSTIFYSFSHFVNWIRPFDAVSDGMCASPKIFDMNQNANKKKGIVSMLAPKLRWKFCANVCAPHVNERNQYQITKRIQMWGFHVRVRVMVVEFSFCQIEDFRK